MDYQDFLNSKMQLSGEHGFDPLWLPDFLFDSSNCQLTIGLARVKLAVCGNQNTQKLDVKNMQRTKTNENVGSSKGVPRKKIKYTCGHIIKTIPTNFSDHRSVMIDAIKHVEKNMPTIRNMLKSAVRFLTAFLLKKDETFACAYTMELIKRNIMTFLQGRMEDALSVDKKTATGKAGNSPLTMTINQARYEDCCVRTAIKA